MDDWKNRLSHPLSLASFPAVVQLALERPSIEPKYFLRALRIAALSLLNEPFRVLERWRYGRAIEAVTIDEPPIFVVGHWRSGTTHLQNLLTLDPGFGYMSSYQSMFHGVSMLDWGIHRWIMRHLMPSKRPMDEMPMSAEAPSEEEFAVASVAGGAVINGLWFPSRLARYFEQHVLFTSDEARSRWAEIYLRVLKKTFLLNGRRPLVLKNPANTARVGLLWELFPKAKFIHIHRDPQLVFASTVRLYQKLMEHRTLQSVEPAQIETAILDIYEAMMKRFLRDSAMIPKGQLIEVRCDDLERRPLEELKKIYDTLDLGDFEAVRGRMTQYLQNRAYQKNVHRIDRRQRSLVEERWGFAFERWGYPYSTARETLSAS